MAYFRRSVESFNPTRIVKIIGSEFVEDHTVYVVEICIGLYRWCIRHRYSDFHALHEKLICRFPSLDWSLLPKKKLFGNQSEQFVMKRQTELEVYLQSLVRTLPIIPPELTKFFDFHKYEVHGITETLAEILYEHGDAIIESERTYHMSPLQLNAICSRLALPEPTCDSGDVRKDLGHLLDFITNLKHLQINGSTLPVGRSNINMNELTFDLHTFKSLTTLEISGCNVEKISELEHLKKTLVYIGASNCLTSLKELLLIGIGRGQLMTCDENIATMLVQPWSVITKANFSHNRISLIDESVKLMPQVEILDLSHNRLEMIDNLQFLSHLRRANLSHNLIERLASLHTKLGNVTALNLSDNKLDSLEGLAKLYSLEILDVSHNDISQILEVKFLSSLPCLESLDLHGNAVTLVIDYRTTVFEMFNERAAQFLLDGEKATSQELDMVAVRSALNKAREQKRSQQRPGRRATVTEATIVDVSSPDDLTSTPSSSRSSLPAFSSPVPPLSPQLETLVGREGYTTPGKQKNDESSSQSPFVSEQTTAEQRISFFQLGHQNQNSPLQRELNEVMKPSADAEKSFNFMLPETLPTFTDQSLCTYLEMLLPSTNRSKDNVEEDITPIHVMWCTLIYYLKPETEIPACVYVTTENVHIFIVKSLSGDTGVPVAVHLAAVEIKQINRITIGYGGLYVQIESSSGNSFTFLTFSSGKTDMFVDSIKRACRRSIPKLDDYEDPNVVSAGDVELILKETLNRYEQLVDSNAVSVLLYMLVMLEVHSVFCVKAVTLVVTSNYIYTIQQDFNNTPPLSSFAVTTSSSQPLCPFFLVTSIFPVTSRIVSIQLYDVDTIELGKFKSSCDHTLSSTFVTSNNVESNGFLGYGVRLAFHLGAYGIQSLDVRMPTSNQRDRFLDTLSQVRMDVSETIVGSSRKFKSSNVKSSKDQDNWSNDSSSSKRSSGGKRKKRANKKANEQKSNEEDLLDISGNTLIPEKTLSNNCCQLTDVAVCVEDEPIDSIHQDLKMKLPDMIENVDDDVIIKDDISHQTDVDRLSDFFHRSVENLSLMELKSSSSNLNSKNIEITKSITNLTNVTIHDEPKEHSAGEIKTSPSFDDLNDASSVAFASDDLDAEVNGSLTAPDVFSSSQIISDTDIATITMTVGDNSNSRRPMFITEISSVLEATNMHPTSPVVIDATPELKKCSSIDLETIADVHPPPLPPPPRITPPLSLSLPVGGYPSKELLTHLSRCFESLPIFPPISPQLEALVSMTGLELVNFFHSHIAAISTENEELRHALWTSVVLYKNPSFEIPSCVLLSTKAIYFVSDTVDQNFPSNSPVKTHKRHSSCRLSSIILTDVGQSEGKTAHNSCGILNESLLSTHGRRILRAYAVLKIKDVKQMNIGVFSQAFRLTGSDDQKILSCVTRDFRASESFMRHLMNVFSQLNTFSSPSSDVTSSSSSNQETEEDFYSIFSKSDSSRLTSSKYVRLIYPPDDTVTDIIYLICERDRKTLDVTLKLLFYILCFQMESTSTSDVAAWNPVYAKPRTLILTEKHLALAIEDHVSYPLPEFARMLPERPQWEMVDVRLLDCLQRIKLMSRDDHMIILVFSDEMSEVIVDTSVDYFSADREPVSSTPAPVGEVTWTLMIQNQRDRDKLIKLISQRWEELVGGKKLTISILP